jgi:hypothetical protein
VEVGLAPAVGGVVVAMIVFTSVHGRIVVIAVVTDPEKLPHVRRHVTPAFLAGRCRPRRGT